MSTDISASPSQYDRNTILLHGLTAAIVIYQFLSAELWDYFSRLEKNFLIISHMSLGFLLAVLLTIRIIWRYRFGIRILATAPSLFDQGAGALHILLYALLVLQMPLGFCTRWTDNQPLNVFGLLISSPIGVCTKSTGHLVDQIHDINAWIIIGLVGIHAAAALVHYYFWHDEVLQRMLPGLRKSQRASL